jgi:hypothetical protein
MTTAEFNEWVALITLVEPAEEEERQKNSG